MQAGVEMSVDTVETITHPAEPDPTDPRDDKLAIDDGGAELHVSQAALDAAEAASAAEQQAKKAAAEKAAQAKAEQEAAQAAVEAKRKADLAEAQAKQQAADAAKSETKKKVTVDDVRAALRKYATAHGNEAAMGILQKHEAVSVSAIDPAKYEDVLKDLA
jgi:colicin import membrane protein